MHEYKRDFVCTEYRTRPKFLVGNYLMFRGDEVSKEFLKNNSSWPHKEHLMMAN